MIFRPAYNQIRRSRCPHRLVPAATSQIPAEEGLHHGTLRELHTGGLETAGGEAGCWHGLLRAEHTLDQTGEQDGHECNQPEPPICKCGKMKRMCLGSNADKHGREGRREQRRERLQCSMREWFKLWTEQRVEAKPESAEAKAQQKGEGITHGLTGWPSGPEYGPGWCRSSRQGGRLRYRSALSCVRQMPPDPSNRRRGRRPS